MTAHTCSSRRKLALICSCPVQIASPVFIGDRGVQRQHETERTLTCLDDFEAFPENSISFIDPCQAWLAPRSPQDASTSHGQEESGAASRYDGVRKAKRQQNCVGDLVGMRTWCCEVELINATSS